jgi:uroporphyrinogen-III synthase
MDERRDLILITRPVAEARAYAAELAAEGFKSLAAPMLEIVPEAFNLPDLADCRGVLFSSVNGVRVFAERVSERALPVYAVGQYTAQEARALGFKDVHMAGGTGSDLTRLVAAENEPEAAGFFLHVRGDHAALALDEALIAQGFAAWRLVVYRSVPVSDFEASALSALRGGRVEAVTFFSRRTAENFMKLAALQGLEGVLKSIKALCISESVLECVQGGEWLGAYICDHPDRDGMMRLLRQMRTAD